MKKIDKLKKYLRIVMILLIIIIVVYAFLVVLPSMKKTKVDVEDVDKVWEYVLYKRDSNLYKEIFNKLKVELNNETINYEKYAEYISELFIVDLYTLSNKTSIDDVGGVQYVIDNAKENYKLNASNTLYKYLNNLDEKPLVNKIELLGIKPTNYTINSKSYDGYEVSLKWEYSKDLGYDKEGIVIVVRDDKNLYVVEKK